MQTKLVRRIVSHVPGVWLYIYTARCPPTGRVYPAIGWSNLFRGLYTCPYINPKELQRDQPIINLCDGLNRGEVWGCSPLSWRNSVMSYSFVVSSFTLIFLVSRDNFNGDIQSWDKWRVFNHPIPYWNLESLSPFPDRFLRRQATCFLHCHGRWSMVSCLIKTENQIIISPLKTEFLVVDLPRSCPTPAANNNKQFNTIGSDKLDQRSCEITDTSLLLVDSSSLSLEKVVWFLCLVSKLF